MSPSFPVYDLTQETLRGSIGHIPTSVFARTIDNIRAVIYGNATPEETWTLVLRMLDQTLRSGGAAIVIRPPLLDQQDPLG